MPHTSKSKTSQKRGPAAIAETVTYAQAVSEPRRKVRYSEEIADHICELIAVRVPIHEITEQPGMPCLRSIYHWKNAYPEFREKYERARQYRAESRADHIDAIMADLRDGRIDANTARVMFDAERWQAGKENSPRYGDKVSAEISGKDGKDLIPAESSPRDLARAVLGILREAHAGEPEIPIGGYQSTVQNSPQLSAASDSAAEGANHTVDADRAPKSALATSPWDADATEIADSSGHAQGDPSPDEPHNAGELEIGEREVLDNRAQIIRDPHNGRYAILDHSGAFHGYRRTRAEAHALAANIKQTPPRSTEIDEEFGRYV